jgi:hypothetical protein
MKYCVSNGIAEVDHQSFMDTREESDGSLVLTYDSSLWTRWLIGGTLVLLGMASYNYLIGPRDDERIIGLLAGAATLAVIALVMLEQCRFTLNPIPRLIEWEQRWGFRRRAGVTAFADVQHVSVETPIGDTGIPSRRVVLHLTDGSFLPLTVGYKPDVDGAIAQSAEMLRRVLGQNPAPSSSEMARALIEQGRAVEAIKILVEHEGLSLKDAKDRVDQIRRG